MVNALIARLGVDSKGFKSGLNKAKGDLNVFERALGGVGAKLAGLFAVGSLVNFGNQIIQTASRLSDLARGVNTNVEAFQALNMLAVEAGASQEQLQIALKNVQSRAFDAANGNKTYAESFQDLGIDIAEFVKLTPERQIEAVAKAQQAAQDPAAAYRATLNILGERAAPALQEALEKLATQGFDSVSKAAKESGQVMSEDVIAQLDPLADKILLLQNRFQVEASPAVIYFYKILLSLVDILKMGKIGLEGAASAVVLFGQAVLKTAQAAFSPMIEGFKNAIDASAAFGQALSGNFSEARDTITNAVRAQIKVINDIPNAIETAWGEAATSFKAVAKDLNKESKGIDFAQIWNDVPKMVENANKAVSGLTSSTQSSRKAAEELAKALKILEDGEKDRFISAINTEEEKLEMMKKTEQTMLKMAMEGNNKAWENYVKTFNDRKTLEKKIHDERLKLVDELKNKEIEAKKKALEGDAKAANEYNTIVKERLDLEKQINQTRLDGIEEAKKARLDEIDLILAKEKEKFEKEGFSKADRKTMRTREFGDAFRAQGQEGETREDFARRKKLELLQSQADEARLQAQGNTSTTGTTPATPAGQAAASPETMNEKQAEQAETQNEMLTELQKVNELLAGLKGALQ